MELVILRSVKKLLKFIRNMSEPAYIFTKVCAIIACTMAAAALCLVVYISDTGNATYYLCNILEELTAAPAAIFLIAAIGSVCLEEKSAR